jgi:uncharacterized OB-fold protein
MTGPIPDPTPAVAPFWDALRDGCLRIQACADCRRLRHPPRPVCSACHSPRVEWRDVSGRGEVWSYTICHPPVLAAFREQVPYNAIVVRLDEGVFLVSNLVGCPNHEIEVGLPVELVPTPADGGVVLPLFRRA